MIVGVVEASTFRMTLRLGDGQVFEIQLEDQSVRSNGGRVGLIRTHNSMMSLTLDHPLPSPVAVLVVLARRGWDLF